MWRPHRHEARLNPLRALVWPQTYSTARDADNCGRRCRSLLTPAGAWADGGVTLLRLRWRKAASLRPSEAAGSRCCGASANTILRR